MSTIKLSSLFSVVLVVTFFTSLGPAYSQVAPEAYQGEFPFAIGAGASNMNVDWGHNRMDGFTIWGQWRPRPKGGFLTGLGLDAEVRDLAYGRSNQLPGNFKQTTGSGGPMFTVRVLRDFQIYAKGLVGLGSIDFRVPNLPNYTHDTRNVYSAGGGFNLRLHRQLWLRADYEYQGWPHLFSNTKWLDPQGFTLGFIYDFKPIWH
ncbi:MAG TPA: outer membrane beta-barrel protein [Terracidiphilus sp.]|nr:outer membrane beta-barrel protein [Terracidiphilus sp.]